MEVTLLIRQLRLIAEIGIVNHKQIAVIAEAADVIEELSERVAIMEEGNR